MDDATADLILALQIEDLADLQTPGDGSRESFTAKDAKVAFAVYNDELRTQASTIKDRRLGQWLNRGIYRGILRTNPPGSPSIHASPTPVFDKSLNETINRELLHVFGHFGELLQSVNQITGSLTCVVCHGRKESNIIQVPCGDNYCDACLSQLFEMATKDESLHPPRCCGQPIPTSLALPFLSCELASQFAKRSVEFTTHDRTYCHATACAIFIPFTNINDTQATCPTCDQVTCTICKTPAHSGDCPTNPALQALLDLAKREHYQQCQQCKRIIELHTGCNHMTYDILVLFYNPHFTKQSTQMSLRQPILLRMWRLLEVVRMPPMGRSALVDPGGSCRRTSTTTTTCARTWCRAGQ